MKQLRLVLALCAFAVPAAVAAGCGGVPGDAVATVDGNTIDKTQFTHWMNVAARTSGQPNAKAPDPPDYAACIADKRKTAPKPAKGQPKTTDAQLKTQCKQQYEGLRNQVLQLLVTFQWIQGEANDLGVKVTDAEVKKSFEQQKKQSFPKDADYQKFLKTSGQTNEDILQRVKSDLLSNKIRDKVTKGKDKAKAEQAKKALDGGDSWKTVAKKYSIDTQSKSQGGKLPPVSKGQQEKALDDAIFKAKKGELTGPVKTQFGWYVFDVTTVTPAKQQSFEQSKASIKQILASDNSRKALDKFGKDYRDRWKGKTDCRKDYVTADCKNAPKQTTTSTVPPGGQQQTAPQTTTQP